MTARPFANRAEAGRLLAERLRAGPWPDHIEGSPLVLAIPRGGIEVAAPIARALGAELDVMLVRKLRAPDQPELALGAVAEDGRVHLNPFALGGSFGGPETVERERRHQLDELARQRDIYRKVRPRAEVSGRVVIVVDDGLATGATMIAALTALRASGVTALYVAVPVGSPDRVAAVRALCDRVDCLAEPPEFESVGQYYRDFSQVDDGRVVDVLRDSAATRAENP
jgi:putative phosphoribosyl transferase